MNELTILVIEDDKTIQNFLKISLQTKGYKYILADNGLSGISYFYADNPDLILLDLGLPDIDGMEVLRQVRQKSEVPSSSCPPEGRSGRRCRLWTRERTIL